MKIVEQPYGGGANVATSLLTFTYVWSPVVTEALQQLREHISIQDRGSERRMVSTSVLFCQFQDCVFTHQMPAQVLQVGICQQPLVAAREAGKWSFDLKPCCGREVAKEVSTGNVQPTGSVCYRERAALCDAWVTSREQSSAEFESKI